MKRPFIDGPLVMCASCTFRAATHYITEFIDKRIQWRVLCCTCYVTQGNQPAHWHPDCVRAWRRKRGDGNV